MRVFCLTSNAYTQFVPGFAYYWNKYFSGGQSVAVVGYDRLPPQPLPRNFLYVSLGNQERYTWSAGLRAWLRQVDDPVFLMLLEDYYLCEPVNVMRVYDLYQYVLKHPEVAKLDLTDDRLKTPYEFHDNGFIRSAADAPYQMSLQAAIWRKSFLLDYLKDDESAWQFEKHGTKRVVASRRNGVFDGVVLGCQRPPLHYVNAAGGGAGPQNVGGGSPQWALKRIPDWMKIELVAKGLAPDLTSP